MRVARAWRVIDTPVTLGPGAARGRKSPSALEPERKESIE
jgi:hypothetical protein